MQLLNFRSFAENAPECVSLEESDCRRCGDLIHDTIPWGDGHPRPPFDEICSNKSKGRDAKIFQIAIFIGKENTT